ncbi:DNA-formamidopyrimidine glycosylase family protein [Flavitalea sp.]|nr:DNA-formamidopyrimidine glycosylase family protein [Flavitalea sp.]
MPEGPSIVIAKEALEQFKGKKILDVSGYGKLDKKLIKGKTVKEVTTWGKHLIIVLGKKLAIRVHFMLFGSYKINERAAKANPKLSLSFKEGELNFYVSQIVLIQEDLDSVYDWSADIMNKSWDPGKAGDKVLAKPNTFICDVLMDQHIFSGVGNIIKNEVMYSAKLHPENIIADVPKEKINFLTKEVHRYSFDFLKWKRAGTLLKHCNVYKQEYCAVCGGEVTVKDGGKTKRRNYYCEHDQVKYSSDELHSKQHKTSPNKLTPAKGTTVKALTVKATTIKATTNKVAIKKAATNKTTTNNVTTKKAARNKATTKKAISNNTTNKSTTNKTHPKKAKSN